MRVRVAIRKRLGAFILDVEFEAPAGISVLFGPSGAGKSLTLRCIAGLLRPEAGQIVVGNRVLYDGPANIDLPARARGIGYVFQQYALFPHLDVAGNVAYGLHHMTRADRAQRVSELLAMVGLDGYEQRSPRELSGGQQQRVALARALAPCPDLLLLDEPFAAVDALARSQLRRELRMVQERTGVPMLMVTHDLTEVRQLATFVVLYEQGRVLQAGVPTNVLAAPANAKAAALLEAASAL